MAKLLYHSTQGDASKVSPFDDAILQVARSGAVDIVCPYIGITYLERIIALCPAWRLISDVQEWLAALPRQARPRAWQFIREHIHLIHHYPALHAKAVVSNTLAMMGSANLTNHGILGRTEMGILLDDPKSVAEMSEWFEALWADTTPPVVDEASAYIQWLDEEASHSPSRRQRFVLSSGSRKVRARLVKLDPGPEVSKLETGSLDLATIAQSFIVDDQKHYETLELAIEATLDHLAKDGKFRFGEVVADVRRRFNGALLREIYFLLLQHCVNHVRAVFVEATINRLVLRDGSFSQSSREALEAALAPFDAFLAYFVDHLTFSHSLLLPTEADCEKSTGKSGSDQVILVAELLESGLLVLVDVPGELPHYLLEPEFEWQGRYQLFPKARALWLLKKRQFDQPKSNNERKGDAAAIGVAALDPTRRLSNDSLLEELEDGEESIDFDGLEKLLSNAADAAAQRRQAKQLQSKQKERDKVRHQLEAADSLLAKLLDIVAGGQVFPSPDRLTLVRAVAIAAQEERGTVDSIISHGAIHVKVFLVSKTQNGQFFLEINPYLSWEMLLR